MTTLPNRVCSTPVEVFAYLLRLEGVWWIEPVTHNLGDDCTFPTLII